MYVHIIYRNGLPHAASAQALECAVSRKNCTGRNCTARYNFGCEKCTGLAKSVPGSEKGPLAI